MLFRLLKYTIYITTITLACVIAYFSYYLNHRPQTPLCGEKQCSSKLGKELIIYQAPNLIRLGNDGDGGYLVPEISLQKADLLLGFGIGNNNSFEDSFSIIFNKPSYGFDCTIQSSASKSPLFHFIPKCIAHKKTDSSNTNFFEQISLLNLQGKKIFIKMDIEGAEYDIIQDILQYSPQITGLVFELHIWNEQMLESATSLLSSINKHFTLVHIHGNNCAKHYIQGSNITGKMPSLIELTYISRNLLNNPLPNNKSYPLSLDGLNCPYRNGNKFNILF